MEKLINLLFIPNCFNCGTRGEFFCQKCLAQCQLLIQQRCIVCDKPSGLGLTHKNCLQRYAPTQCVSFYEYTGVVRNCIKTSKFDKKEFAALKILCEKAFPKFKGFLERFRNYTLVPIPLSKEKFEERGFNQADLIAQLLAKTIHAPLNKELLMRSKETEAQYKNNRIERFRNLSKAFVTNRKISVKGKGFLLLDDITTTGATFLSAAYTLYSAGAYDVRCLAISKKLLDKSTDII